MNKREFICQREAEGRSKCREQCEHCKIYFKPLENQINKYEDNK